MVSIFLSDTNKGNNDNVQPHSQNEEGTISSFCLANEHNSDLVTSFNTNNEQEEYDSDTEDVSASDKITEQYTVDNNRTIVSNDNSEI